MIHSKVKHVPAISMGILRHVQIDALNASEFELRICQIGTDDNFGIGSYLVVEFGHRISASEYN